MITVNSTLIKWTSRVVSEKGGSSNFKHLSDFQKHSPEVFCKSVLKSFANFTGKQLSWNLFLIKFVGLRACNFIKKRLQHRSFPVKFAKFLRTSIWGASVNSCFWPNITFWIHFPLPSSFFSTCLFLFLFWGRQTDLSVWVFASSKTL